MNGDKVFEETGPGGTYLARICTDGVKERFNVYKRDDEGNERWVTRLMFKEGAKTLCRKKAFDRSVL